MAHWNASSANTRFSTGNISSSRVRREKGNSSHAEKESTSHVGKVTSSQDGKKEALPGMTGTESLEASFVGKEIQELRENSEEIGSLGYRRRKKSNFIDS